jgi:hypothetical protein
MDRELKRERLKERKSGKSGVKRKIGEAETGRNGDGGRSGCPQGYLTFKARLNS